MQPLLKLGGWNFWFLGEVKIFFILGRGGGNPIRGGLLYFVLRVQFIVFPFPHFEIQGYKNSKIFCLWHPSFSVFTFSDLKHAGLQVVLTLTLNINFLFQGAASFHPLVGTQNQPNQ